MPTAAQAFANKRNQRSSSRINSKQNQKINKRLQIENPFGLYSYHITNTNITEVKVATNGSTSYDRDKNALKHVPTLVRNVHDAVANMPVQNAKKIPVSKTTSDFHSTGNHSIRKLSKNVVPYSFGVDKKQDDFHISAILSQKPNDDLHLDNKARKSLMSQVQSKGSPLSSLGTSASLPLGSNLIVSGGDLGANNNANNMNTPGWANRSRTAALGLWEQRGKVPTYFLTNFDKARSRLKTDALNMANMQLTMPNKDIWKCLVAELVGTIILIVIGCGSGISLNQTEPKALDLTGIGLCWGLTVATLAQTLGHVSGCHMNPAVTLAMMVTGKIQLIKAGLYIVVQCVGAMIGAAVLKALTPDDVTEWGVTKIAKELTPPQGFGIEFLSTFVLLMVIFAVSDENRDDVQGSKPLAIGLTISALIYFGGPLTGTSLNPARSLGPAIVSNYWTNHWVYWIGPIGGAITAATLYQQFFRALSLDEIAEIQAQEDTKQRDNETKESTVPNV